MRRKTSSGRTRLVENPRSGDHGEGMRRPMPENDHEAAVAEFIRKRGSYAMPDRLRLAFSRLDCSSRSGGAGGICDGMRPGAPSQSRRPHTIRGRRCVIFSTEKCSLNRCGLATGSGIVEALVRAKVRGGRYAVDRRQDHAGHGYKWCRAPGRCGRADLDRRSGAIAHQDNVDRGRGHAYGFDDESDSLARCQTPKTSSSPPRQIS
jgi:hypothetical protein